MLVQNVDQPTNKEASGDYMRGLNEGTMDYLNSLLSGTFISGNLPIDEDN